MAKYVYDVYFLDDYVASFNSRESAEKFINESVRFDKENNNPFGAKKENYSIERVECRG